MRGADFPRQQARTRRFTLGVPRAFTPVAGPDGPLVLFLQTGSGTDPVTCLKRHDPVTGRTSTLVDPRTLEAGDDELPAEERARRERAREQASGIVAYAVDDPCTMVAFALAGRLYTVEIATGVVVEQPTIGRAFDPRPAPDGRAVAYHADGGLHLVELPHGPGAVGSGRTLVAEPEVSWGRAEFIAAEEMGRHRGFWWSGDSTRLAVTRVDERGVPRWTIADPARPSAPATEHRYPAAGTANAAVSLWVVEVDTGRRIEVRWDRANGEYLAHVGWGRDPLTLLVQPRDQRSAHVVTAEPTTGETREVGAWRDEAWVELVPGSPTWSHGTLFTVEDRSELGPGGTRVVCQDGRAVTPAGLQVRELLAVHRWRDPQGVDLDDGRHVVELLATPADDPTRIDPYTLELAPDAEPVLSSDTAELAPGVRRLVPGRRATEAETGPLAAPWVEITSVLDVPTPTVTVNWVGRADTGVEQLHTDLLEVVSEWPSVQAVPRLLILGERRLRAALLLPSEESDGGPLPVLLDPYGGPHVQRVLAANAAYLTSQWFADQGFAVLVIDGRGTPGRGPTWERAVHHDLATPVLADQVDALRAAAEEEPRLDLSRVAIRGWSFGGYLAALAVLRRPEVFRAAIAGAPVTDWRLYDTHYTERYLGHPEQEPEAYRRSSLMDADGALVDAADASEGSEPELLLIHGLADDNVVAAHSLRLSAALLADGRAHRFLPLSGVTHMTPQEVIAERLLTTQVTFLRESLGPVRH
ncbi:MAG: prolyl oligopeptidase family serine peptidase [Nitriliruptoraceae bacterium]